MRLDGLAAAAAPRELVVNAKDLAPTWPDPGAGRRKEVVARRAEQERKGDSNGDEDEDDLSMACNDTDAGCAAMVK